ncbi:MAG: hypothetical protein Fur005_31870 [Roseiflexaceae bacterium]
MALIIIQLHRQFGIASVEGLPIAPDIATPREERAVLGMAGWCDAIASAAGLCV